MSDVGEGGIAIQSEFINLFMKSVGVSLTELQDVVFKYPLLHSKIFYPSDWPTLSAALSSTALINLMEKSSLTTQSSL